MTKLIFDLKNSKPVSITSTVKKVGINPKDIKVGQHEFYDSLYLLKFNLELLDEHDMVVGKAEGFSSSDISDLVHDVQRVGDVNWTFVVSELESVSGQTEGVKTLHSGLKDLAKVQKLEVVLTQELKEELQKIVKPLSDLGHQFDELKKNVKSKAEEFTMKQQEELKKVKEQACDAYEKVKTKIKNKDFSKKEAAALGAGAVVLLAALFRKK